MTIVLITITVGVPLYQLLFVHCCKKFYKYIPNMLKLMGLGILCCLINKITQIIIHATTMIEEKSCKLADENCLVSCYLINLKIMLTVLALYSPNTKITVDSTTLHFC